MTDDMTKYETTRFGEISVEDSDVITFPKGLLGFEHCRRFCLISDAAYEPFGHLQSLDESGLAFVVVNPRLFFPHYKVEIDPQEIAELAVTEVADVLSWVIVTVPEDFSRMSVNLQGPLLCNARNNRAKQVVLVHSPYTTCHYIADEIERHERQNKIEERQAAPV